MRKLRDIEKADWYKLRRLYHFSESIADQSELLTYLTGKYGYKTIRKAIKLIPKEYKK